MSRAPRRLLPILLAATFLAACQGAPTTPGGATGPRGTAAPGRTSPSGVPPTGPTPGAGGSTPPTGLATPAGQLKPAVAALAGVVRAPLAIIKNAGALIGNDGSTLIGNDGSTLIGNDGSTLIGNDGGTLIGNDGSTLIGNDGSTLIGNDGSTYRLQAVKGQAVVQGAVVRLLTAAGQPVMAGGKPVEATTDQAGAYAFAEVDVPPGAVVVAELGAAKKATLRALAPRSAGKRTIDVEIVSTLTAAYILETYVATQADRDATLAKLTPEAEAATRAAAERLLTVAKIAVPADLSPTGLASAFGRMRGSSKELDGKLVVVEKQLIAAGLSDLGAGAPALEIPIGPVGDLAIAPDGTLWFPDPVANRIWKLRLDGTLQTAVGVGSAGEADDEGKPAATADLDEVLGIDVDGAGRLLFSEYDLIDRGGPGGMARVTRLEADGTLHVIALVDFFGGFMAADGDAVWTARPTRGAGPTPTAWMIGKARMDGGKPVFEAVAPLQPPDGVVPSSLFFQARLPGGQLRLLDNFSRTYLFDPAAPTAALAPIAGPPPLHVDRVGNVFTYVLGAGPTDLALSFTPAGGQPRPLWQGSSEVFFAAGSIPFAVAPDGTIYGGEGPAIFAYRDGVRKQVAGAGQPKLGAGQVPLAAPGGVAIAPDGTRYIADDGGDRILKLVEGRPPTPFAGNPAPRPADLRPEDEGQDELPAYTDEGDIATEAWFRRPSKLLLEKSGALLVLDGDIVPLGDTPDFDVFDSPARRLRRIGTDGKVRTLRQADPQAGQMDVALAPDGTIYVYEGGELYELGDPDPVASFEGSADCLGLACGPDGTVYAYTDGELQAWKPGQEATRSLSTDSDWLGRAWREPAVLNCLTVDAKGRLVLAGNETGQVVRFDPATKAFKALAGPGTPLLAGIRVDDGLLDPRHPAFGPDGDLYVTDFGHRQVKRIPAAKLD